MYQVSIHRAWIGSSSSTRLSSSTTHAYKATLVPCCKTFSGVPIETHDSPFQLRTQNVRSYSDFKKLPTLNGLESCVEMWVATAFDLWLIAANDKALICLLISIFIRQ